MGKLVAIQLKQGPELSIRAHLTFQNQPYIFKKKLKKKCLQI
jgi:hypothetical protein